MRVVVALNNIARDVVQWPRGDRLATVKQGFQRLSVLPDIIGAVDGTHISIKKPHVSCFVENRMQILLLIDISNVLFDIMLCRNIVDQI